MSRGRPKKEVTKDRTFKLRLDEEQMKNLEYLSSQWDVPKSEVVRILLTESFYNYVDKQITGKETNYGTHL